jgi:Fe-S-cluster containining protein
MLLPSDYQRLEKIDDIIEEKTQKITDIYYLLPNEHNVCPYFDLPSKKCSIYKYRPKVCRAYPFAYRNSADNDFTSATRLEKLSPNNLYLSLCERFWSFNQGDYKEGVKAIFQLRREKLNLGILSDEEEPTEKEREIRSYEEKLEGERKEKKFPFDLYLFMIEQNKMLFLMFLKLFDAYFDDPDAHHHEYKTFINTYIDKFGKTPELLQTAFNELKTRWKNNKKESFDFSFTLN